MVHSPSPHGDQEDLRVIHQALGAQGLPQEGGSGAQARGEEGSRREDRVASHGGAQAHGEEGSRQEGGEEGSRQEGAKKAPAKKAAKKAPAKKAAPKPVAVAQAPVRQGPGRQGSGRQGRQAPGRAIPPVKQPSRPVSPFSVGDKVVYPHHGAAVITKKERREFAGGVTDFFVLQVAIDQLILRVPVSRAVELGVRPVISRTAARRVLSTFRTEPEEAGANWSRWYKLLTEKITSGDIYQVAEVVRDLTHAQQTKGISPALKRMLSKARLILASELRFALDLSEEDSMKRLDKALPKVESDEEE